MRRTRLRGTRPTLSRPANRSSSNDHHMLRPYLRYAARATLYNDVSAGQETNDTPGDHQLNAILDTRTSATNGRREGFRMLEALIILLAGVWAGTINTVVGSGTLITFPTLLLLGYPPITANVSNNIGLLGGGISGAYGYRAEARAHRPLVLRLAPASVLGALTGAVLLLTLPADSFNTIVPVLISIGLLMVIIGPAMQRRAAQRNLELDRAESRSHESQIALIAGIYVLGIYGGYFGAAQGILLVGLMGILLPSGIQHINAVKNVLSTIVNAVAAVVFMVVAWDRIDWKVVALIGSGSLLGGYLGARIGRRLSPLALRAMILVIGSLALAKILFFD